MSGGIACACEERKKPLEERAWVVIQRNSNFSAFNGYRQQWSVYSALQCRGCGRVWRSAAGYVSKLQDGGQQ